VRPCVFPLVISSLAALASACSSSPPGPVTSPAVEAWLNTPEPPLPKPFSYDAWAVSALPPCEPGEPDRAQRAHRAPEEQRVYEALVAALTAAPSILHFGHPAGDRCHVPCGTAPWVCGAAAERASIDAQAKGEAYVVSHNSGQTIVGFFTSYFVVRPGGSVTEFTTFRSDVGGNNCGGWCGWHSIELPRLCWTGKGEARRPMEECPEEPARTAPSGL
jgi:hypothetical protein